MMQLAVFAFLLAGSMAQSPGNGISKSTYATTDPISGKEFLMNYFPLATPGDECTNDLCVCPAGEGGDEEWYIQQGRVYLLSESDDASSGRRLQSAGSGFGMHMVNVSNHLWTGGISVQEVEAHFTRKIGNFTEFDAFMDYNVMLYTADLSGYISTFKSDGLDTLTRTWQYNDKTWTSVFLHVPNTQLVIELVSDEQLDLDAEASAHPELEQRAPSAALDAVSSVGAVLTSLQVSRAASAATFAKLDDFYVTGMGATLSANTTGTGFSKKCYLWSGAEVNICFTTRPEDASAGEFSVAEFEDMLNTVHTNFLSKTPYCGVDKWFDNHYAIDSRTTDTAAIIKYIDANSVLHYCNQGGLHYAFDPTGWGIQMDLSFSTAPADCSSSSTLGASVQGTGNPACMPGNCGSSD